MPSPRSTPLPWLVASALLLGCRAAEPVPDETTPFDVPEAFSGAEPDIPEPDLVGWWSRFGDDELDAMVGRVLTNNYDLRATTARLESARAQARIAGAALYPQLSAGANAGRNRQNFVGFPIPGGEEDVLSTTIDNYGVSLDVSWELDLWGKLDARAKAAGADFRATEANWHQARLSLAGQTVKTWLALAEAREQRAVAQTLVTSFEQTTGVMRDRFQRGRMAPLDLQLAESQLAGARAQVAIWDETIERVQRSLEFLLGEYPDGDLALPDALPPLPERVPAGLPARLLERRPDLIAAEERLRARSFSLYAARKDLYPSLSLTGSAGRRSAEIGDVADPAFDIWSWAANLAVPIFQGGRLEAAIDSADAEAEAALYDWSQSLLAAFVEVETALAVEESLARREAELTVAARTSASARTLSEERYFAGRSDILAVITARQQAIDSERALLSARREYLELRVDLYLALGGGFDAAEPQAPPTEDPSADAAAAPGDR